MHRVVEKVSPRMSAHVKVSKGSAALAAMTCLALLSACAPRYQHVVEHPLPSNDELVCPGYLVWNDEPVRDVFLVINGSGAFSNAFVVPGFDDLLDARPVAYATYDKPGIHARFGDPRSATVEPAVLERYTLGHGVACATRALSWARETFGPSARLHLRGHSEGTLVSLYLYEALLDSDPETARSIETIVLSGLPLEPFDAILERQLATIPNGEELRAALASCDWAVLRERMGVSCAYVEDAARRPSGRTMFERLAARAPVVRFHVFQGNEDWHTPVEPVRELEAWNASTGHLDMQFHFYEGAHRGSEAAHEELARLLESIASP